MGPLLETNQDWLYKYKTKKEGLIMTRPFAHMAKVEAIKILIAFAAHKEFKLFKIDVKSAFCNGNL